MFSGLCYRGLLIENTIHVPAGTEMNEIINIVIFGQILIRQTTIALYCLCELP